MPNTIWCKRKHLGENTMPAQVKNSRRKVRFTADPFHHASIDFNPQPNEFNPEIVALICNESYNGCCVVALKKQQLQSGARIRIKIGGLAPMMGEVRWVLDLDVEVVKIGIELLE
jgi:hypothetical protein